MNPWAQTALLAGAGYLLGSVPFGLLLGKLNGIDVREHGSKNIGATNVGRLLGRKWGFLAFLLDLAKGLIPTLVAGMLLRTETAPSASGYVMWMLVGMSAVLGHNFPVYLRFKGGKGVATSLGMVLGVYPYFTWAGLVAFFIWIVCLILTRYVSVASIAAALSMPIDYLLLSLWNGWQPFGEQLPLTALSAIMGLLIVYRHRTNIQRLRNGTENRISKVI